jgi:pimeloyl-ACP methyl ester carboxylesterase
MRPWHDHLTAGIGWREWPGDGPVAVCLHGIGSRAASWARLAEWLPDWRVIAWDAPGYGRSDPLPVDVPGTADYARALLTLLDALALPHIHLVGHSLGTLIGAAFAADQPDRVQTLTLAACAQGGGQAPDAPLAAAHQARIADLEQLGPTGFARSRAARLIHNPDANPVMVADVTTAMASVTMPGYAQAVRMLAQGDLAADCARVIRPAAVIVGACDIITPPAQSARAHAALMVPGPFVTVPACGHAIPVQAPAALAELILSQSHTAAHEGATR